MLTEFRAISIVMVTRFTLTPKMLFLLGVSQISNLIKVAGHGGRSKRSGMCDVKQLTLSLMETGLLPIPSFLLAGGYKI